MIPQITTGAVGLAGELRVMSELLLRGHNPAKSYLNEGPDLVLENGYRVEVKTARRKVKKATPRQRAVDVYRFSCSDTRERRGQWSGSLKGCAFVVLWCIEDDVFYVVPIRKILDYHLRFELTDVSSTARHHFAACRDAWHLLEGVRA